MMVEKFFHCCDKTLSQMCVCEEKLLFDRISSVSHHDERTLVISSPIGFDFKALLWIANDCLLLLLLLSL